MGLPEEDLAELQVLPYAPAIVGNFCVYRLGHQEGMEMVCRIPLANIEINEVLNDVRQQR